MNLFKKIYFVFTRDYETRLVNSYEYCGKESIGFLSDVKKRFQIDYRIPIVNYTSSPNSSWYYNNLKDMKNFEGEMIKAMDMAMKAINLKESVKLLKHLDKSIDETKKMKDIQARQANQINTQEAKAVAPTN